MAGQGDDGRGQDPGFDWMYGDGSGDGPPGRRRDADPTRRIPVQRPGGAGTPDATGGPQFSPTPPVGSTLPPFRAPQPAPPARSFRPSRWRRPRTYVRLVTALLAAWLVFTIAVPFLTWSKVDKVAFEPSGERPADQPGTTYLLVGSDSRKGLSPEERKRLSTGDAASELTDTIMLLHWGSGPTTLISVPRDSPLEIPGFGRAKVNSAFAKGGIPLLTATLEKATGLRIDGFVEIGLGGLAGVVDAVGGIEICPKQAIKDKPSGLDVPKGCQQADGTTALAYARARKYSKISDLARVQQQREVVAAVGAKVKTPRSVLDPIRWWRLNGAVPDFFRFGDGVSAVAAGRWALAMSATPTSCTVPLARADATWDTKRAARLFDAVARDRTDEIEPDDCTATGLAP